MTSSVVALHTDLASPWPAMEWRAASKRSLIVCPDICLSIVGLREAQKELGRRSLSLSSDRRDNTSGKKLQWAGLSIQLCVALMPGQTSMRKSGNVTKRWRNAISFYHQSLNTRRRRYYHQCFTSTGSATTPWTGSYWFSLWNRLL